MLINSREELFLNQFQYIIGIDEAGRGPWAGPVTVGAVLVDKESLEKLCKLESLNDSKKLTHKKRAILEKEIEEYVLYSAISDINVETIDRVNILEATKLGVLECLEKIIEHVTPRRKTDSFAILIDGKFNNIKAIISELAIFNDVTFEVETMIDGDALCPSIAAASILAKEHRDNLMIELHKKYPEYCFDKHKGYGTKLHNEMLQIFGPSDIHRKSFAPIKKMLS